MNKKEKEENITNIVDTVAFEIAHTLYTEINEHIFDRDLAKESDDKTYQAIYKEIYYKVIKELDGDNWWENTTQNDK
jgi:transcriptional regulator CtsR